MTPRPVIDAGPALNFFSVNRERLLIATVGRLSTPETVKEEVLRKAATDPRFSAASAVWTRLHPNYLDILPDAVTEDLSAVVERISGLPMVDRQKHAKDLGETMVIAHAVVAAEAGGEVTVVIDETNGAQIATAEMRRLNRLRDAGRPVGAIRLVNTPIILERAAGGEHLPNRAAMRALYERLRDLDDGLVPIENTRLLLPEVWAPKTTPI